MIKNPWLVCISTLIFGLFTAQVLADIYKNTDANGVVTYSNLKSKGAIKLNIPNGSDFSRVGADLQKQRDAKRQSILEAELKSEQIALKAAKEAYAQEASKAEIARQKNSDGKVTTYRNMEKFNEKMKPLQAELDNHQNNIELLQKELNGMR